MNEQVSTDQNISEIIPQEYSTAGWQESLGSTTTPHHSMKVDVPIPDIPMPGIIDLTDRMKPTTFDVDAYSRKKGGGLVDWSQMDADKGKIPMTTTVKMTDTHNLLSDGKTWVPKYETYIHGTNNEKRIANEQKKSQTAEEPILDKLETESMGGNLIIAGGIALVIIYSLSKIFK